MFSLVLAILLFAFGVFFKITKIPGFASSKKLAWVLIITGGLTTLLKLTNLYLLGGL